MAKNTRKQRPSFIWKEETPHAYEPTPKKTEIANTTLSRRWSGGSRRLFPWSFLAQLAPSIRQKAAVDNSINSPPLTHLKRRTSSRSSHLGTERNSWASSARQTDRSKRTRHWRQRETQKNTAPPLPCRNKQRLRPSDPTHPRWGGEAEEIEESEESLPKSRSYPDQYHHHHT